MSNLRVWQIPQVGIKETFYVPVSTVEERKKILDLLKLNIIGFKKGILYE